MNKKIISLCVVLLMLMAGAITVNKTLFGKSIENNDSVADNPSESEDPIVQLSDGTTVVHTGLLQGTLNGYAGPVPLDIHISDNRITDIIPLENTETPSFFKRASALFPMWIGKSPAEALSENVDAVTGATYSSQAIINNVNVGLSYYEGSMAKRQQRMPFRMWVAFAVTLAACIIPLFVKGKLYHNIQLMANVVVLGFWCGQFLDYTLILKYLSDGFLLPGALVAIVMLIAAFIYPLFGKPQHYCNHICPLGSAQQLVGQLCKYKVHISAQLLNGLDWFRKILWAVLMLFLWTDCLTGWMDLELFQAFQFKSASWWIIGFALFFVLLSVIVSRPYCRFVCPTGSLFKRAENIG